VAETIDVRGRSCPEPVIRTRAALSTPGTNALKVLVDSRESLDNVKRMASGLGWGVTFEEREGCYEISIEKLAEQGDVCRTSGEPTRPVILVPSERFGDGEPELGEILMRAAIKTMRELSPRPSTVIFLNSGVKFCCEGSPVTEDIEKLKELECRILCCGTCLDYYRLKDSLQVGVVSNMFEILSTLAEAPLLVRL